MAVARSKRCLLLVRGNRRMHRWWPKNDAGQPAWATVGIDGLWYVGEQRGLGMFERNVAATKQLWRDDHGRSGWSFRVVTV